VQLEATVSRLEALTRTLLAAGQLPAGELLQAVLAERQP